MHVEQAAPQPIDRPLSALECYESRGWPNMSKANIEASEFPLSAPLPTAAWTRASPIQVDAALALRALNRHVCGRAVGPAPHHPASVRALPVPSRRSLRSVDLSA
jgi:hypothetical protein